MVHLIEEGRLEQALETSEILLSTASSDETAIAELVVAIIALKQGYAYPRDVIQQSIMKIISASNSSGSADYKTLTLCAYGMESVGDYELRRGVPESAAIAYFSSFQFYEMIQQARHTIRVGLRLITVLTAVGRTEAAQSIVRSLIESDHLRADLTLYDRVSLLSQMAQLQPPRLDILLDFKTGQVSVSDFEHKSSPETSANQSNSGQTAVFRLVSDSSDPIPRFYRAVVIGNAYINELLELWMTSNDALESMRICTEVLQAQRVLGAPPSGLLAVASRLLDCISAAQEYLASGNVDTCVAMALSCEAFVAAALEIDDRLAGVNGHQVYAEGLKLWLAAERIGSVAFKYYLTPGNNGGYRFGFDSDVGRLGDIIIRTYPFALEASGKYAEAVAVYRQFVERQEIRQAAAQTPDILLSTQSEMKETYVRLSRCLFKRYLLEGNTVLAIEAAEALELHKARRLRAAILEKYVGQSASWRSAPLRYAASQLPAEIAICSLGINPATVRINGRWIYVAITGSASANSKVWVNELSPGEQLQVIHEWFTDRLSDISRRGREQGSSNTALLSLIEQIAPEAEILERFQVLSDLLLAHREPVRMLYLSTEQYAFHLPWAGAVAASSGNAEITVSVVPSSAFVISGRRQEHHRQSSIVGAIYFDSTDPALELAAEQLRAYIEEDSDGDQSWIVQDLDDSTRAAPAAADLDIAIVLSHGSQASGITSDRLAVSLKRRARCVLLLGCWSATMSQDLRHMEIEGTVTQVLESGAEAVVASVWPLPALAAIQFGSAFALALESCAEPASAFSAAVQVLRLGGGAASHPAVWGGFALYG